MSDHDDAALRRLRAADPAASATTDTDALRRAVQDRIDADPSSSGPGTDELAARRARRGPPRWLAAAAAAVVVGLGGYGLGVNQGGDGSGASQAAADQQPPVVLGSGSAPLGAQQEWADTADGPSRADGAESSAGTFASGADDRAMIAWGRATFTDSGLPSGPATAEAYGYDADGIATAETAARLAAALGVDGEPVEEAGSWHVGDWSGPTLQVMPDGTASVSFSDPTADPWACAVTTMDAPDGGGAEDGGTDGFAGCDVPEGGGAPQDAVAQASAVLQEMGVDVGGLELTVDSSDEMSATVGAYPEGAGGQGVATWSVSVSGAGVFSVYGSLAPLTSLGEYDVVSPAEAVDRLMDPRFGQGGGVGPMPLADGAEGTQPREGAASADSPSDVAPPAPLGPGAAVPWPVESYEITGAELVQGTYYTPDGAALVLPAWLLTSSEGYQWSVVAIVDGSLDFASDAG